MNSSIYLGGGCFWCIESVFKKVNGITFTSPGYMGGKSDNPTYEEEIKILQRLVKQRKESASIFLEKGRKDLADNENAQALVISSFLPEQISDDQVEKYICEIIIEIKANGMKDMGKVMGLATKKLAGKAEGKLIASLVKKHLST